MDNKPLTTTSFVVLDLGFASSLGNRIRTSALGQWYYETVPHVRLLQVLQEAMLAGKRRGQIERRTEELARTSPLVSRLTGYPVQYNKAIVGRNAFAHESGIHQDGMLKNQETYEIMTPASVGVTKTSLVMGKHSGRHAFKSKLEDLGYSLSDNALQDAFVRCMCALCRKRVEEEFPSRVPTAVVCCVALWWRDQLSQPMSCHARA